MKMHNTKMFLRAALLLAAALTVGKLAQAQTCSATWTGNAGDGAWSTAGNWSPRRVPGPTSNVCIPLLTTANATPPISIHSLQISQGGDLIIESGRAGASFSVATSLNNQGLIQLYGAALSSVSSLLSATSVLVESGGTLSPGGTVQCSITNNGTVSPGILTVAGNYSQAADAALTRVVWQL